MPDGARDGNRSAALSWRRRVLRTYHAQLAAQHFLSSLFVIWCHLQADIRRARYQGLARVRSFGASAAVTRPTNRNPAAWALGAVIGALIVYSSRTMALAEM